MQIWRLRIGVLLGMAISLLLSSCTQFGPGYGGGPEYNSGFASQANVDYSLRLPATIDTNEKVVIVDPNLHVWGAYDATGKLVHAGPATAGGYWCLDVKRSCKTKHGVFRVHSLGDAECRSSIYPKPKGGGLMPFCMFFNGGQALHGALNGAVVEGNISHGCVRMRIHDAEWLRNNFVEVGTKVIIQSY
jgi:hypothetical protein